MMLYPIQHEQTPPNIAKVKQDGAIRICVESSFTHQLRGFGQCSQSEIYKMMFLGRLKIELDLTYSIATMISPGSLGSH